MSLQDVQVRPHLVFIGKNISQVQTISTVADVASSLNNKYFAFHDAAGAKRYVWFNVGATGVDPAPAGGWTGHVVAFAANSSATAIATAIAAVLNAVTGFTAVASGFVVTLNNTVVGYAQPVRDATGAAATGFSFKVITLGQAEYEAGCIQGDIEITGFEQSKLEIICHATGTTVKDERITGYSKPQISMTFQETDKASLKKILVMYGMSTFTPIGVDKDEVFGYGPVNVGGSNPKVFIRLHPVADGALKSNDWNLWNAELSLDTFNFSGENLSVIPATFSLYPDETKPLAQQFFLIGDATKAGY